MSLKNAFGDIALEQTQLQILQALAPSATEATLAAAKALLENSATEFTLGQVKTILQSIQASSADKSVTLANPQDTFDSGEREIPSIATLVTNQGDTLLKTPAPGKRLVLRWIYAVNKPTAASSPLINIRIGNKPLYTVWAVSKRQLFVGDVDQSLFINLSEPGEVALTALVEEV